jgi:hypothetical protein
LRREKTRNSYLSSRLYEKEEELGRERSKTSWDKFSEEHHLRI